MKTKSVGELMEELEKLDENLPVYLEASEDSAILLGANVSEGKLNGEDIVRLSV